MAYFGDFSDTDDSQVEELLSEVQDLCVLEQISKINCSSFTDSLLPSDLDTRFRKLKSLPVTKTTSTICDCSSNHNSASTPKNDDSLRGKLKDRSCCDEESEYKGFDSKKGFQSSKEDSSKLVNNQNPDGKFTFERETDDDSAFSTFISSKFLSDDGNYGKDLKKKSRNGSVSPFSDYESFSLSPSKQVDKKKELFKSNSGSFNSVSGPDFHSPPLRSCFFWCSPKKVSRRKSTGNWNFDGGMKDDDELLPNLGIYSVKEQKKIVKKAMEEEAKVIREAEKIVKLAKEVSGRMNAQSHNGEDDPSDDDLAI